MKNKLKTALIFILILGSILIFGFIFLIYGPNNSFRDWLINTSMSTRSHKFLSEIFYDKATIEDSLLRNSISSFGFPSNLNEVNFVDYSKIKNIDYKNEYEKEVLTKDENNNDYKIIKIDGEKYNGYLAVIYKPENIQVAVTKYLGKDGQYLTKISEQNKAILSINGGGFVDPSGSGTGGEPLGITISKGKLIHETVYNKEILKGGLVGITGDNKLFLGDITGKQALKMGIRDGVSFGPFLIVNGVSAKIKGMAGGLSPRTAIGQRKDGIFLFLVLDGDRTLAKGASYQDLLEIMEKYGAYNASCLDGGTSTGMAENYKLINNPTTKSGKAETRPIPTAFVLKKGE